MRRFDLGQGVAAALPYRDRLYAKAHPRYRGMRIVPWLRRIKGNDGGKR